MNIKNQWFTVNEIFDQIFIIDDNGESNIYLIVGSKKALLIDTGWGVGNLHDVVSGLTNLPLIVVNTHGHPDHVSGGYLFSEIHIKKEDREILEGCFNFENRKWALENVLKGPFPESFNSEKWLNEKIDKIIPIKDGHVFNLGNRKIEVINISGHSPGGIGLLDKQEKLLFSGDSILQGDIWMHLDHSTTLEKFLESLSFINTKSNQINKILPAHGKFPLEYEIINELIEGVESILSGDRKGKHQKTFAGDGLLCRFNTCGIIYK